MSLARFAVAGNICTACRGRLFTQMQTCPSGSRRQWLPGSRRHLGQTGSKQPSVVSSATQSSQRSQKQAQVAAVQETLDEPVILFQMQRERFKFYYLILTMGLITIPLYINERQLVKARPKMQARRLARAKVLNEPTHAEDRIMKGEHWSDKYLINSLFCLSVGAVAFVVIMPMRIVTLWKYDFQKKIHHVTTFTPFFRQRSFSIADENVHRLGMYKNKARVKVKNAPMAFLLEFNSGYKPNPQLYNIVLGTGDGAS